MVTIMVWYSMDWRKTTGFRRRVLLRSPQDGEGAGVDSSNLQTFGPWLGDGLEKF